MKSKIVLVFLSVGILSLTSSGCKKTTPADPFLAIEGEWQVLECSENGTKFPAERVKQMIVTFKDGNYFRQDSGPNFSSVKIAPAETVQLNPSKTPGEIDLVIMQGEKQGMARQGSYEINGDTLKIVVAETGQPRPTEFVGGDKKTLMVLKKK